MEGTKIESKIKYLFNEFESIGKNPDGKGVTRLGYEIEEDQMHEKLLEIAKSYGFNIEIDSAGNSIVSNVNPGEKYFLMGSHLDSVIEGGSYDGVLGVLLGLAILIINKEENLHIPLKVIAFRCEESSNFSLSTIGSKLFSGADSFENMKTRISKRDKTLEEVFQERNYNTKPYDLEDAINYIEIHIEQGRVLESVGKTIGIVSDIAGNYRFHLNLEGLSEHSGATPMDIRRDALCCGAEIILTAEKLGLIHETKKSRVTVGVINNSPNALNVVPGNTSIDVDIRGIDDEDMKALFEELSEEIEKICSLRNIEYEISNKSFMNAVKMNEKISEDLVSHCESLGISNMVLPSGAGHDAMNIAKLIPTGMLFIPCKEGISHNPLEEINYTDAVSAINVLIDYYKRAIG